MEAAHNIGEAVFDQRTFQVSNDQPRGDEALSVDTLEKPDFLLDRGSVV